MRTISNQQLRQVGEVLKANDVHIWCLDLDACSNSLARLERMLSPDEYARASRFSFKKHQHRFIAARGLMRMILGSYLGVNADQLRFRYNKNGKPYLQKPTIGRDIQFNLSHSQGQGLLAVTQGCEIGVDIEVISPRIDHQALARRFFSAQEWLAMESLTLDLRRRAFFHCWSCKEAYIKARGEGLANMLKIFDVNVQPDEPARLLATRPNAQDVLDWRLVSLDVKSGYAAALAINKEKTNLVYYNTAELLLI